MRLRTLFILAVITAAQASAQKERVHLDLDKYNCRAGDTLWFKGYIFRGPLPSGHSTNLYVELLTGEGKRLRLNSFPVFNGQTLGQVFIPDTLLTGSYYLVAFTRAQLNYDTTDLFSVPLLVYNKARPGQVFHKKPSELPVGFADANIRGIRWVTAIQQGMLSSLLETDSGSVPRRLQLEMVTGKDSSVRADRPLSARARSRYALFPDDTTHQAETVYLYEDSVLLARRCLRLKRNACKIRVRFDTLSYAPHGYNAWVAEMPDQGVYYASISVTDAGRSIASRRSIDCLEDSYTDNFTVHELFADTGYIQIAGTVTDAKGKPLKAAGSQTLSVMAVNDTAAVFSKSVGLDSTGRFALDSLFLYGRNTLDIELDNAASPNDYNILLQAQPAPEPVVDTGMLASVWEDDSIPISKVDTAFDREEAGRWNLRHLKTLQPAIVSRAKNPREQLNLLNGLYTTGVFSEPTALSFDLRFDSLYFSLQDFLRANVPGIGFDPFTQRPGYHGMPVLFYLDEHHTTWDFLNTGSLFRSLAFAKAFANEQWFGGTPGEMWLANAMEGAANGPAKATPSAEPAPHNGPPGLKNLNPQDPLVVCLYTRKGADFRVLKGQLHQAGINGYSKILWFTPNNVTLFWGTLAHGSRLSMRFKNSAEARRFRLKIEGISYNGAVFHYETVLAAKK